MEQLKSRNTILINIIGSFVVKGLALVINFFTVPLYMDYFENSNILGVWYTILSFLSWILMFDLGIGNGLRNNLVKPLMDNDNETIKKLFSSSYIILGVISFIIAVIGGIAISVLNWNDIFNISPDIIGNDSLKIAFLISFLGVAFQFFLKTILSILNAMEKTALSNGIALLSSCINLIYLLFFRFGNDIERLFNLSLVYAFSVNIPLIICTILLFSTKFKRSIPNMRYFDIKTAKIIINLGMNFFVIQILFMLITASNEFFVTNKFGADKVVEFQVYNKIFYTFVTIFSLISNPIWSAVTRFKMERNYQGIRKIYIKLLLAVLIGIIIVVFIGLIYQPLVDIWLGDNSIIVNDNYIIAFILYICVLLFVFALNSIANGLQILYPQLIFYSLSVLIKVMLLYILKISFDSWIIVIWINTLTLIPYVCWQLYDFKKKILNVKRGDVLL